MLLLAYAIIILSAYGINLLPFEPDFTRTGQFGDSFGALSAFMAMVAAASAFATYRSQSEELVHMRKSEKLRDKSDDRRDFENTFFSLVNIFRDVVKDTDVKELVGHRNQHKSNSHTGTDAFSFILRRFEEDWTDTKNRFSSYSYKFDPELVYNSMYLEYKNDLPHYFRLFYHILKFVYESQIEDKLRYTRIIRSLLSSSEITLIALNCVHGAGKPKLKKLVEDYAMLHNASSDDIKKFGLAKEFDYSAFGDRTVNEDGSLAL